MDRETVIRLAREAWQDTGNGWTASEWFDDRAESFERFAAAVDANCVPPGWKLVPIEPDIAMVIAGENKIGRHAYKAMLSAAPAPKEES